MESKPIAQEDLQEIANLRRDVAQTTAAIGQLEYAQASLSKQHQRLHDQLNSLLDREESLVKSLSDKYGNGTLNLDTGEFQPAPAA